MEPSAQASAVPATPAVQTRHLYIRNHSDQPAKLSILSSGRLGERVIGEVELAPDASRHWRGKSSSLLNFRVSCGGKEAVGQLEQADPLQPFELFVVDGEDGPVLYNREERNLVIGGRVATVAELDALDDLTKNGRFVENGIQPVRGETEYAVAKADSVLCPEELVPAVWDSFGRLFSAGRREIPTFSVASIRNARVVSAKHLVVVTQAHRMVKEQQNLVLMLKDPGFRVHVETRDLLRVRFLAPSIVKNNARRVDKPTFLLGNGMAWNYGHWLLDIAPRLLALEKVKNSAELDILLPGRNLTLDLWKDFFTLFDVDAARAVFFDELAEGVDLVEFRELVCPGFQHIEHWGGGIFPAPAAAEMYAAIRDRLDAKPAHRRVYVSRKQANTRRMHNEDELCAVLAENGFEIVVGEDLSLIDKLKLFAETKVVAGLMGSNLVNCIMMPPGGLVLEIFGHEYMLDALRPVAAVAGQRYAAVVGESVGDQPRRRKDILAPVDMLRRQLPGLLRSLG